MILAAFSSSFIFSICSLKINSRQRFWSINLIFADFKNVTKSEQNALQKFKILRKNSPVLFKQIALNFLVILLEVFSLGSGSTKNSSFLDTHHRSFPMCFPSSTY
jgi:hypothetical protein